MANRVTAAEVKEVIKTKLSEAEVDPYVTSANAFVDQVLGTDTTLSAAILKEIERWTAAHMIASSKTRQAKREEAGGAKVEYTGEYGANLASTSYGQMALSLDTSGKMAATGRKVASVYAVTSFS